MVSTASRLRKLTGRKAMRSPSTNGKWQRKTLLGCPKLLDHRSLDFPCLSLYISLMFYTSSSQ